MTKQRKQTWMRLFATLSGEMKPEDIPLAPGVDVEALKEGDDQPLEVVVEIPAGESTRGWDYRPESLKAIVDYVSRHTLSGFLGHQKPEDIATQFLDPATHWVGAKMVGETAYFRGVVDAAQSKLKRWIKTKRIKQVSIFGFPELQTVGGKTKVVGYKPLSIDWTPLDRSGMPTRVVAIGEMDDPNDEGGKTMTWEELLAQLKELIESGSVTLEQIWSKLDPEGAKKAADVQKLLEQVKAALGVTDDNQLVAAVEDAAKAVAGSKKAEQDQLVQSVVKEKVTGEMAQDLIMRLYTPTEGATKETIAGEIDALIADERIKAMVSRLYVDTPTFVGGKGSPEPGQPKQLKKKSTGI